MVERTKDVFDESTFILLDSLADRGITGNAAINAAATEMSLLSEKSAELFWRIIKKDLRAGFGDSTVNKVSKGFIQTFPYMRCVLAKDANLANWCWGIRPIFSQEKADGMFVNLDVEQSGIVRITSRNGSEYDSSKFEKLVAEAKERLPAGNEFHGELEVYRDNVLLPRQTGNGIINSVLAGGDFEEGDEPRYKVWDCVPLDEVKPKAHFKFPYERRLFVIAKSLKQSPKENASINLIATRVVKTLAEAYEHASELMKAGKEGTVVKHPDLPWKDTGSSGHPMQVKIKLEFEVSLKVVAIVPGKADSKIEGRSGSLTCKTSDGLLVVDVTIKNEKMRDDVDANPEDWIDSIIDVVSNDIMPPSESNEMYSLFLPRMAEAAYRTDKSEADDLNHVIESKRLAIFGEKLLEQAA
jgi:DNA ligase 1